MNWIIENKSWSVFLFNFFKLLYLALSYLIRAQGSFLIQTICHCRLFVMYSFVTTVILSSTTLAWPSVCHCRFVMIFFELKISWWLHEIDVWNYDFVCLWVMHGPFAYRTFISYISIIATTSIVIDHNKNWLHSTEDRYIFENKTKKKRLGTVCHLLLHVSYFYYI